MEIRNPGRSWQEIADDASHEKDSNRLQELSEELERALDDRATRLHLHPQSDSENKKQSA